jgi:putative two-component system response regulator
MRRRKAVFRALVIDDNTINRNLARAVLGTHDFEVDQASDGSTGLAMLRRGKYDLVLLDISMPGMDGREVCRKIRADSQTAGLHVVAYTAHAFPTHRTDILRAGFNDLLIKPISMQAMAGAIAPVLGQH